MNRLCRLRTSAWRHSSGNWPEPATVDDPRIRIATSPRSGGPGGTRETQQQRRKTGELSRRHMLVQGSELAGGLGGARSFAAHAAPAPEASRDATKIMT